MTRHSGQDGGEELLLGFDMAPLFPGKKKVPEDPVPQGPKVAHPPASRPGNPEVLTVAQLTRRITSLLQEGIGPVWVEGEISNLRIQSSGHSYFTIKDASSQLSCVLFARNSAGLRIMLRDGLQVQLFGKIDVYEPRGQYQLIVSLVQERGIGMLQARLEELKRRLAAEGLFSPDARKPLPRLPRRIGVVTSPTGAAIRDFLQVLHRRHPGLQVVIHPVRVQGKGAALEIAAAVEDFNAPGSIAGPVDVIVVTRGGGSLEDLWEFNEEAVARAIADSLIPVVSAVGHEIDFTIADFAADCRAPTPSAAAEILAADGGELLGRCEGLLFRIARETFSACERISSRIGLSAVSALFREPGRKVLEARQTLDRMESDLGGMVEERLERLRGEIETSRILLASVRPGARAVSLRGDMNVLSERLTRSLVRSGEREKARVVRMETALSALDPSATLRRGFSITRMADGRVVTSASAVKTGDALRTMLADGEIVSEVSAASGE